MDLNFLLYHHQLLLVRAANPRARAPDRLRAAVRAVRVSTLIAAWRAARIEGRRFPLPSPVSGAGFYPRYPHYPQALCAMRESERLTASPRGRERPEARGESPGPKKAPGGCSSGAKPGSPQGRNERARQRQGDEGRSVRQGRKPEPLPLSR